MKRIARAVIAIVLLVVLIRHEWHDYKNRVMLQQTNQRMGILFDRLRKEQNMNIAAMYDELREELLAPVPMGPAPCDMEGFILETDHANER